MKVNIIRYMISAILGMTAITSYAVDSVASAPINCTVQKAQVSTNRVKIKQAFAKGDGCTAGNLEIQNHAYIQANLVCFPGFRKNEYNLFQVMDKNDARIESIAPSCDKADGEVMVNHQKIKEALLKGDGCAAGNLQIKTHQIASKNSNCFPAYVTGDYQLFQAIDKVRESKPE